MSNADFKNDDIITATDLKKSYRSGKQEIKVLKGINLNIKRGEFLTIKGASGVGKSTLLHIIGLLDDPSSGNLFFQGIDSRSLKNRRKFELRNRSIGFIFQFFHLLPEFSALENVLMPSLIKKSFNDADKRALELLDLVGLGHRLKHKPSELSGGEQQRVAVARALMNKPEIILADEPTGNLDSRASKEILDLLVNLNDKFKQTIIVVTHNEQLAGVGTRRLNMVDGKLDNI